MKIREALAEGKRTLKSPCSTAVIDTPDLDALLLLSHLIQSRRENLIIRGEESITGNLFEKFLGLLERRRSGECIAYILGHKEFRGLEFLVNPNVLVPRPDTETLLEAALENIDTNLSGGGAENAKGNSEKNVISLLDICTGSGALAISLKNERPFLNVSASDISIKALETATLNDDKLLSKDDVITFIKSDLFENISGKYNIIISNPPYVSTDELTNLTPEIQLEPRLALDGGPDGLTLIRKIITQARDHLLPNGVLLLEASPKQMPVIHEYFEANGFSCVKIYKDLAYRERVALGKLNN